MAGTYTEGQSKVLSGVYSRIVAALSTVTGGQRGIVAYPFTADWGPVNVLTPIARQPEFATAFNAQNSGLTAKKIYDHAFKGNPSQVLAYRMATGEAAKGTADLADSASVTAIGLETLYPTNRSFVASVRESLTAGNVVIEITEGGVLLASVEGGSVAELVERLNQTDYVRVTTSGESLPAVTSGVSFEGGNNGDAVTATEFDAFRTELEADTSANAFALDRYDAAEIAATETYLKRVRNEGFYVSFVSGGPSSWDNDGETANDASKAFNYRGILNVGNGVDGYTAQDMAIFIAARVAAVGLNQSLTDEITDYGRVNRKLTKSQRIAAKQSGTVVFVQEGDNVVIDEAVNTLTTPGVNETKEFGKIRVSNTVDYITSSLESFGNEYKKGRSNTAEARETYAATVEQEFFVPLSESDVIDADFYYRPDPEYHGDESVYNPGLDEAFFYADFRPIDSMEKVYQKLGVSFN